MMSRLALFTLLACACSRQTPPEPDSARPSETEKKQAAETTPAISSATPAHSAESTPNAAVGSAASSASAAASSTPAESASASASATPSASAAVVPPAPPGHRPVTGKPAHSVSPSPDDPLHGKFTLADALEGLSGKGKLSAEIKTELGKLECELYEDRAPITVANFVGLARGLRPFKDQEQKWVKRHAYDGTTFHRVIKGFMIQGGDPAGTGAGEPGYVIPDEVWPGAYHSERGQLCMANRGPDTNGMQFFIMDGDAAHLDSGYTIFGKCGPEDVIQKLASVEVQGDRSVKPTKIEKVTIKRSASSATVKK